MRILREADADAALIRARRVAVLGFGAQGRAHALNLRDSGVTVTVGLRPDSPSEARCHEAGAVCAPLAEAVESADFLMMLVPDEVQPALYRDIVERRLRRGGVLGFAHGFNIHYGRIAPRSDLDVLMVAPLGIGDQVRRTFVAGGGVPALLAVQQDASGEARALGLSYALANGHGRAGILETSFAEETETDLFAEQVVLCGGVTHLITAAFETLVEAGYAQEIAYFSCLHELKLITDLIAGRGIAGMRESISSTAEFGDYTRGPRIIDEHVRAAMRTALADVRSGRFARELAAEIEAGAPTLAAGRARAQAHAIETVGARLRGLMPWLDAGDG